VVQAAGVPGTDQHAILPGCVLFVCTMNAVRSVMAAGILAHLCGARMRVCSAGVNAGVADPLVERVMDEIGISVAHHRPQTLDDLREEQFDLIISLAPEAHHKALEFAREKNLDVEYWPTMDATVAGGHGEDERQLRAYRQVRDQLFARIKARFRLAGGPSV